MRITGGRIAGGGNDRGGTGAGSVTVDSHRDHRMAMSLAVAALNASVPVTIQGAECVSKSYGNFWKDFNKLKVEN
jgi:3-phosphoshikimate 1-carboxyvinyltransferase